MVRRNFGHLRRQEVCDFGPPETPLARRIFSIVAVSIRKIHDLSKDEHEALHFFANDCFYRPMRRRLFAAFCPSTVFGAILTTILHSRTQSSVMPSL